MLVCSMSVAFADDPTYSLTIQKAEAGHTYTAYQIFGGTLTNASGANTDNKVGDVVWGNGITEAGKTALLGTAASDGVEEVKGFNNKVYVSAQDLANELDDKTASTAIDFANAVTANNKAFLQNGSTGTLTDTNYVISGLPAGYYVVVDTWTGDSTKVDGKDYSISRYMVQVVGNATVVNKADKPTVEKKLKNKDELIAAYRDANNVAIGDTIDYQIKTAVPNMVDYTKGYWFVVKDHMSKGLTYTANSLAVTLGDTTLSAGTDYTLTVGDYDETAGTDIKVVFTDFFTKHKDDFGKEILITYSATLNENAVVGGEGNPNNVEIIYSNNPNEDYGGKNEPGEGDDDIVGKTPKDWTKTYTINLKLTKVDKDDSTKKLQGAAFTVKGYKENDVATFTETYTADDDGTYYKLKGDTATYTEVAPTALTASKYDSTTQKYKLEVTNNISKAVVPVTGTYTTDEKGLIELNKIAAGRYVFTEITAPTGYNLLTEDIVIDIKVDTNKVTWSDGTSVTSDLTVAADGSTAATWSGSSNVTLNAAGDTFEFTVQNASGATLPETGGVGTTIFYIAGSLMVLAAAILLITKRRMGAED